MTKKENGITIIALIVTIVVLLILAGVSISLIIKRNGIISKAEVAKQETEIADEKEKINLSALAAQANNKDAVIRRNDFDKELKKFFNEDYTLEPDSDAEEYEVTCKKSGRKYTIKSGITKKNSDYELNNNNTTFSLSPSGWTKGNVIVNVKTTIQEYTLQTSKDGKNWNDSKEQVFSTNGIMYARLWNGSESVSELQYEVKNIDKNNPKVSATAINTNSIKISASDSESGIIGYAVTTSSTKPEKFTGVTNTKSFENSTSKLTHNTTYYVWIKDEAGNTSQYSLKTPELKAGSLKLSKATTQTSDASDVVNNIGSYIGSTVTNYTPNGGDKNVGWKIFYAGKSDAGDSSENDHIYLIADDCIDIKNSAGEYNTPVSANGNQVDIFNDAPKCATLLSIENESSQYSRENSLAKNWIEIDNDDSAIKYMIDTERWSKLYGSKYAEYAIASPTGEMYVKSWNCNSQYKRLSYGYDNYGCTINGSSTVDTAGYNTMYFLSATDGVRNSCYGYWLIWPAKGASLEPTNWKVSITEEGKSSMFYSRYGENTLGFRPVVCLNTNVRLQTDGMDSDGKAKYKIVEATNEETTVQAYTNGEWSSQNVYATLVSGTTGSGISTSYESIADSAQNVTAGTTNTSEIQREGTTTLRVKTTDGTNTVYSNNYNVKIDKTSPTPGTLAMKLNSSTGEEYTSGATNNNIYIKLNNGSDSTSGQRSNVYKLKGVTESENLTETSIITNKGTTVAIVTTVDNAGNTATRTYNITKQLPKLATPRLTADGYSKLTWNRVENATKYVVQSIIETVEVEKDKTSYDALKMLKSFIDKEGNSFNAFVRIKAVGDGINYEDSNWSESVWLYECLSGETEIDIYDEEKKKRRKKKLKDLKVGDKVISFNTETKKWEIDEVLNDDMHEVKFELSYDIWTFSDGTQITTVKKHEFYNVSQEKLMYIDEWNMGDKIYKEDGTTPSLIKHEQIQEPIRHYTLMNHNHNYIANGCLSGTREMRKIKVENLKPVDID
jgi:hypothetical protein